MADEVSELRLKILSIKEALRNARSDRAREYAKLMLKELETYLEVLETKQMEPAVTKPPKEPE